MKITWSIDGTGKHRVVLKNKKAVGEANRSPRKPNVIKPLFCGTVRKS